MKKEKYFTAATIQRRAEELLHSVMELRRQRQRTFDPSRSALLVLDMQNYFLDPGSHAFVPSGPAIISRIKALARSFTRRQRPVVFTRHLNTPRDAGMMAIWWKDIVSESSPLSAVSREFGAPEGQVLLKSQYDAFFETDLESLLDARSATQVVICGLMTHLCCETTARSGFMRGFEVFFTVDGTASYDRAFHAATLLNLSHGFATPVLAAEILSAFKEM